MDLSRTFSACLLIDRRQLFLPGILIVVQHLIMLFPFFGAVKADSNLLVALRGFSWP